MHFNPLRMLTTTTTMMVIDIIIIIIINDINGQLLKSIEYSKLFQLFRFPAA